MSDKAGIQVVSELLVCRSDNCIKGPVIVFSSCSKLGDRFRYVPDRLNSYDFYILKIWVKVLYF